MTLRTKARKKEDVKTAPTTGLADFEVGQKVDTTVRKVEPYGMFLQVVGSRVSGLCHRSEVSVFPSFVLVSNILTLYLAAL